MKVNEEEQAVPSLSHLHLSAHQASDVSELMASWHEIITLVDGQEYIKGENDTFHFQKPESSFGRDSNQILEDIMDVPERPIEIQENLAQMFRLIDAGNLADARQLRQNLANEIGEDDPEFVRADVLIRRKEILNR